MGLISFIKQERCGFITTDEELESIVKESRLHPCIVRCQQSRFVCPAQDAKHLMDIINASGKDSVRDISLQL